MTRKHGPYVKLSKTTFLRINKPADFRLVDEILGEITTFEDSEIDDVHLANATQRDVLDVSTRDTDSSSGQVFQVEESLKKALPSSGEKIKFTCTVQYETPAELAAVLGQIWINDINMYNTDKIPQDSPIDVMRECVGEGSSERMSVTEVESVETEQMRRLIEIASWRRSLLADI
jgi:hypothetical protein